MLVTVCLPPYLCAPLFSCGADSGDSAQNTKAGRTTGSPSEPFSMLWVTVSGCVQRKMFCFLWNFILGFSIDVVASPGAYPIYHGVRGSLYPRWVTSLLQWYNLLRTCLIWLFSTDTFKVSSPHPVAIPQNVAISDSCDLFSKYKLNKKGKKTAPTHICSLLTF